MSSPANADVAMFVQDVDALGGSERQALLLAEALVRRGVRVRILSCVDSASPRRWLGAAFPEDRGGVRLHRLARPVFESASATLLSRQTCWRTLYAVGFMMGAIAARVGRLLDAPVVVKLACSGEDGDLAALRALPKAVRDQVQSDLATATLVCLTEELEREAREAGFPPDCLVRIPNGVDIDAVAAAAPVSPFASAAGNGSAPASILFAGRLDRQKNVGELIEAARVLRSAGRDVRLLLAGDGPDRARLEREVERAPLPSVGGAASGASSAGAASDLSSAGGASAAAVRFLGRRDDVPGLLRGATVCCLPSRSEGMSNTLLEALAAGTPIVASDLPANRELLGDAALLAPPRAADMAGALGQLLDDADLRQRLSTAGRERVQSHAIDSVAAQHAELFASLRPAAERPGAVRFAARFLRARGDDVRRLWNG